MAGRLQLPVQVEVEDNVMERTWWESMGGCGSKPVERLRNLMREGRVRRVAVDSEQRSRLADFPVTGTDPSTACDVLDALTRLTASEVDCTIMAELADLDAARVAAAQTSTP